MPKAETLSENEQLAEKRSFEGNCEILRGLFTYCPHGTNVIFGGRGNRWEPGTNEGIPGRRGRTGATKMTFESVQFSYR